MAAFIYWVRKELPSRVIDTCLLYADGIQGLHTYFDSCDYLAAQRLLNGPCDADPNWKTKDALR